MKRMSQLVVCRNGGRVIICVDFYQLCDTFLCIAEVHPDFSGVSFKSTLPAIKKNGYNHACLRFSEVIAKERWNESRGDILSILGGSACLSCSIMELRYIIMYILINSKQTAEKLIFDSTPVADCKSPKLTKYICMVLAGIVSFLLICNFAPAVNYYQGPEIHSFYWKKNTGFFSVIVWFMIVTFWF